MKVKDILKNKGPEVFTIGEEKFIRNAVEVLVKNNIGALLVLNDSGKIVGIITERDILRESYNNPDNYLNLSINQAMTKKVIVVEPEDDIDYVESIITQNRIRHLPVVSNKILVGLISIGDLVKAQLSEARYENKYLMDYIGGGRS
jgi:CBS domain-containing protein